MIGRWILASGLALCLAAPAAAACQLSKLAEIPLALTGRRAMVTAQINGRDARFILDSGAFFSVIPAAQALDFGLPVRDVGFGARLKGVGGDTSLRAATVKSFTIAGQTLPRIDFVVGGSDTGSTGLLGQNILGLADVEYDLPHGMVRLMNTSGCHGRTLAYWAGSKPVTMVAIEPMGPRQRHTIGDVVLDGHHVKAVFDTGAEQSLLILAAARRLGISTDGPGVVSQGYAVGLGQKRVPTWRARFDRIDIGGEAIARPWLAIVDQPAFDDADMLIGIDFFLTHRIYVDNQNHRMWITYEGGPLFGLDPKGAVDNHGAALDLTDKGAEPTDAAGFARRGGVRAAAHKLDLAIADFDHAIALAPNDPDYVYQRGMIHLSNHQPLLGAADLDTAIRLAPANAAAYLARAWLRLDAHDRAGALADAKAADGALTPAADRRLALAFLYDRLDAYDAALPNFDLWLNSHAEDHARGGALNGRCWARAMLGRDLAQAERDCAAALHLHPNEPAYLDSRALVRMRLGQYAKAIADYDATLPSQPRNALGFYLRGVAERHLGQTARADADRTAALALTPTIGTHVAALGLDDPTTPTNAR